MTGSERVDLANAVRLRRDLLTAGLSDKSIAALVKAGDLHRVRHGAYCDGELWADLSPEGRHRVLARSVLRTAHRSAVLTHVSAAIEHAVPVWGVDLSRVHLTRTDGKPRRKEAGVVHHRGILPADHVVTLGDVRVSAGLRTAFEMCTITGTEQALVSVDGLLAHPAVTPEAIETMKATTRHWPGSLRAEVVMRLSDPRRESAAESRTFYLCWKFGLPCPEPQVPVLDEWGRQFARVDFGWPGRGVFLEFDGRIKYERYRRPGESLDAYLMREKRRSERICQLTGWVCIRIGWTDLENPIPTAERIRRLLASRAGWAGIGAS